MYWAPRCVLSSRPSQVGSLSSSMDWPYHQTPDSVHGHACVSGATAGGARAFVTPLAPSSSRRVAPGGLAREAVDGASVNALAVSERSSPASALLEAAHGPSIGWIRRIVEGLACFSWTRIIPCPVAPSKDCKAMPSVAPNQNTALPDIVSYVSRVKTDGRFPCCRRIYLSV